MIVCEACRREVHPGSSDVVCAVEVIPDQGFGGEPSEPTDGRVVYFHREHLPDQPTHYRPIS